MEVLYLKNLKKPKYEGYYEKIEYDKIPGVRNKLLGRIVRCKDGSFYFSKDLNKNNYLRTLTPTQTKFKNFLFGNFYRKRIVASEEETLYVARVSIEDFKLAAKIKRFSSKSVVEALLNVTENLVLVLDYFAQCGDDSRECALFDDINYVFNLELGKCFYEFTLSDFLIDFLSENIKNIDTPFLIDKEIELTDPISPLADFEQFLLNCLFK